MVIKFIPRIGNAGYGARRKTPRIVGAVPFRSTTRPAFGIFKAMTLPHDGVSAEDLFRANEFIARGDYEQAIQLLELLVADDPTESSALAALGIAFTESGEHAKALKALERAIALKEDDSDAHQALGCAHFRLKEYQKAKRHLERARELAPDDGGVLRNLGVVLNQLGDWEEGTRLIERAFELNEWDYQAVYALASVRLRQGELEEAVELLERVADGDSPMDLKVLAIDHVKNLRRYLRADRKPT